MTVTDKELDELRIDIARGKFRIKAKAKIKKLKQKISEIEYEIMLLEIKIDKGR